jgi:hypothetical protein
LNKLKGGKKRKSCSLWEQNNYKSEIKSAKISLNAAGEMWRYWTENGSGF